MNFIGQTKVRWQSNEKRDGKGDEIDFDVIYLLQL
jgi:hypothetical protein